MIALKFFNPIIQQDCELIIREYNLDYCNWGRIKDCRTNKDICKELDYILKDLDCTIEYSCGRVCMTTYPLYDMRKSLYYYYLIKLQNYILYNNYLDKLINIHIKNIIYEYNNPIILPLAKNKSRKNSKKNVINKYIKLVTHDLFTGEEQYEYYNANNEHTIKSNNPNLLEHLNNKNKRVKSKKIGVPISAMTFNFKKK